MLTLPQEVSRISGRDSVVALRIQLQCRLLKDTQEQWWRLKTYPQSYLRVLMASLHHYHDWTICSQSWSRPIKHIAQDDSVHQILGMQQCTNCHLQLTACHLMPNLPVIKYCHKTSSMTRQARDELEIQELSWHCDKCDGVKSIVLHINCFYMVCTEQGNVLHKTWCLHKLHAPYQISIGGVCHADA